MLEKFRFRQIPRRYSHCLYLDDASRYIRFFVTLWRIRDWSWCLIPGARVAVRRFCWLIMFAAIAIIPYDIRHKHRLTKFATHCWHRKPRYRFLPQTARYYLHGGNLVNPGLSGSQSNQAILPKNPVSFLRPIDRSYETIKTGFRGRPRTRFSQSARFILHIINADRIIFSTMFLGSFRPFDRPRVPRSSRNIIDTIGIYRFQSDGFLFKFIWPKDRNENLPVASSKREQFANDRTIGSSGKWRK